VQKRIAAIAIGLTLLLTNNRTLATSITLYDGTSGVTPDQYNSPSPWLNFGYIGGATQTASNNATTLNTTTNNNIFAGYSNYNVTSAAPPYYFTPTTTVNPSFPVLDANAGYSLSFTVQISSETNTLSNRAGFSVIAISSNGEGIELDFTSNSIFSQNSTFTGIDEQATDLSTTLGSLTQYNLDVSGSSYTLSSGSTTILTGLLQTYTVPAGIGGRVYDTPNFIFLGDDTTAASASVNIQSISVDAATPVPYETPAIANILVLVGGCGIKYWLKNQKSKRSSIL